MNEAPICLMKGALWLRAVFFFGQGASRSLETNLGLNGLKLEVVSLRDPFETT